MNVAKVKSAAEIARTGLQAESRRLSVIANNIANSGTTRTVEGGPYRRKDLALSTLGDELAGVNVGPVVSDTQSPLQTIFSPGNPDADATGFVQGSNVELPIEMMHMMTASRAYQANVAVLKRHVEMQDATMELLR